MKIKKKTFEKIKRASEEILKGTEKRVGIFQQGAELVTSSTEVTLNYYLLRNLYSTFTIYSIL